MARPGTMQKVHRDAVPGRLYLWAAALSRGPSQLVTLAESAALGQGLVWRRPCLPPLTGCGLECKVPLFFLCLASAACLPWQAWFYLKKK